MAIERFKKSLRALFGAAADSDNPDAKLASELAFSFPVVYQKVAADGAGDTLTATTAATFFVARKACRIKASNILPAGALTAHGTTYATLTINKNDGAGGADTALASVTTELTGSGHWVAGQTVAMTLATSVEVAAGEVIGLQIAKASTGVAVPVSAIQLDVEWA